MKSIETVLDELRRTAGPVPFHFREPLPDDEIAAQAEAFLIEFGVPLPGDYLALLRVTDGLDAGMGYIDSVGTLIEQNREVWFDHHVTDEAGIWQGVACKPLTYIWLGYEGNSAEQVYDLESKEYRQVALGGGPVYRGTLVGLLSHMIYGPSPAG